MAHVSARLWRMMRGSLQWRVLWLAHAKFMIGVTGVVRDGDRILLLRHRLWREGQQWGLPTGYANKSETWQDTIVREVKEETGLDVTVGRLVSVTSGYKLRAEVAYEAQLRGGRLRLDAAEILEAAWFSVDALPDGLMKSHRALIEGRV
ncbi:NUDIX domain-containing protein [Actinomadura napierensis]|uniref:NUDIX domain-containing protein n=1 Tax=Actinomadura napierensis TaxID=267854 RepID=A0ABP5LK08_9ACTN